jgi:hypothetical protein
MRQAERGRAQPVRGQRRCRAEHRQAVTAGGRRAARYRADARRGNDDEAGLLKIG